MIITIHNTTKIVTIHSLGNEMPARIWEGHTESGIPVHCYITRIAVAKEENNTQFQAELKEMRPPSLPIEGIPLRLIL